MRTKRFSRASVALALGALGALVPLAATPVDAAISLFPFPCSSGGATTGNFNGDAFDDLAIGAPGDDVEQIEVDGSITRAGTDVGSVSIVYANRTNGGLDVDEQTAQADSLKFIAQNSAGVSDDSETNDTFGYSLAAGDFNGDGKDDLAVGVPGENSGRGAVHVFYSDGAGLDVTGDQVWSQDTPGIEGSGEANDLFGYAIAAGDFNNDGRDDLAVGAPREDIALRHDAGSLHVIYGTVAQGLSAGGSFGPGRSDQVFEQGPGVVRNPEVGRVEAGDAFGAALAVGQFNGGGPVDLAVGAPGEDLGTAADAGAVRVMYSNGPGLTTVGADFFHQGSPHVEEAPQAGDRFGCALAAGDFDGDHGVLADGTPTPGVGDNDEDLAIGVPGEPVGSEDDAGVVQVLYNTGRGTGIAAAESDTPGNLHTDDQLWTENSDIPGVAKKNDRMGASLASADFNGDRVDDLAIGLPTELLFENASAGSARVLRGQKGDGLDDTTRIAFAQSPSDPASNCWLYGIFDSCFVGPPDYSPLYMVEEEGDQFGASLAAGDFDNDKKADLAVGAPGEDLGQFVNWLSEEETTIPDELLTNFSIPIPLSIDEIENAGIVHIVEGGTMPTATGTPPAGGQDLIYRDSGGSLNQLRTGLSEIPLFADNEIKPDDPVASTVLTGDAFGHDQS